MKLDNNSKKLLGLVVLALVVLYLLNYRLTTPNVNQMNGKWTVYGTMDCGWTRKQLDHMKSKQIPHAFIDCSKKDCGEISAFPTMDDPNGKRHVGFNSI